MFDDVAFQSTLPARGATLAPRSGAARRLFQSTLPARGATADRCDNGRLWDFNPRSPHGERQAQSRFSSWKLVFQSTLPARGATVIYKQGHVFGFISIHAPRTGSDSAHDIEIIIFDISIHAPRTGSDTSASYCGIIYVYFNPRSPHGERRIR